MLRAIDRYNLIDASSHLMGDRMDYDDVQIYLRPFQIDINNDVFERRSFSSSYQYAKTILNYAEDEVVIEIANQLGVETALLQSTDATSDFDCWIPGHFRLFVSHVSADKETAKRLSDALRLFGISAFVAHADIKPGREWEVEIEQALRSMHALTAILGPGFRDSDWCDQEVGAAVGLGHLVVPLLRDAEPYGFFAKFQGIRTNGMSVGSVAKSVFSALATSDRTRTRLSDALVSKVLFSDTP